MQQGVGEDVVLQLLQRSPRVDAQLLGQPGPGGAQHPERLSLSPVPIQRKSKQLTAVLAQGMGLDMHLQIGYCQVVAPNSSSAANRSSITESRSCSNRVTSGATHAASRTSA
jgi:hypothetical protein